MAHKFIFKELTDISRFHPTGKTFDMDREMEKVAEIWGSLITLYGKFEYAEGNMDEAFTYIVEAIMDEKESICFEIYHGPTGLAIGIGKEYVNSPIAKEMADAFMKMLENTIPTDFDYVGYYWDYGTKVELGVVNGKGYAREIELEEEDWDRQLGIE